MLELWLVIKFKSLPDKIILKPKYCGLELSESIPNYPWTTSDRFKFIELVSETTFLPALDPAAPSCNKHAPVASANPVKVSHRCTEGHLLQRGSMKWFSSSRSRFNLFSEYWRENPWKEKNALFFTKNIVLIYLFSFSCALKDLELQKLLPTEVL